MSDFALTRDWLAAREAVSPEKTALIANGAEYTYRALHALVFQTCGWLLEKGIHSGDHVAVLLPNCLAYVSLIHALTRLGAVLVPLNTRLTGAELEAQIALAECTYAITTDAWKTRLSSEANLRTTVLAIDVELADVHSAQPPAAESPSFMETGLDRLQAIVFTSGTSGKPKGAKITYSNHFHNAIGSALRLGVLPDDRWLACMPLYHVGGLAILLRACLYGTTVILHNGFDPERVNESLEKEGVSIVSLVPTMLYRLLLLCEPERWASLRLVLLGGAAADQDLLQAAQAAGIAVATTYGLTEAASQVATMMPGQVVQKPGSVGRPLLFTEVRIVNDFGATLGPGQIGEICVRGPGVFAGYYGDESATAVAMRSGELHTGDLGYVDDEGDLWVIQRRSDLIVSGGENVYPAEVETVLAMHPAVAAACVVGLPDVEWGQTIAALLVVKESVIVEDLLDFAGQHLAAYKIPRTIQFTAALPQTGSGKVSRTAVADLLRQGRATVA